MRWERQVCLHRSATALPSIMLDRSLLSRLRVTRVLARAVGLAEPGALCDAPSMIRASWQMPWR